MSTEGRWESMLGWFLTHRLIVGILTLVLLGAGIAVHPFDDLAEQAKTVLPPVLADIPRDRVAVDAIPDIGENQQIVFTTWPGRSPTDIEDQITYPLTTQLLGLPGVKTVRSSSMFGFSSIYVIFEDGIEFSGSSGPRMRGPASSSVTRSCSSRKTDSPVDPATKIPRIGFSNQ